MRILKTFCIAAFVTAALTGCTSIHKIPVPMGIENAIKTPPKSSPLTVKEKQTWGHADLVKDSIPGMSVSQAYAFLKGKPSEEVIVAINDSGVDLNHEDLKDVLWTNPKEIPENGIDDDKNGYTDDLHGWNFLGGIYDENLEITRLIKMKSVKFEGKISEQISESDKDDYAAYLKMKEEFDEKLGNASNSKNNYNFYYDLYKNAHAAMIKSTGKENYKLEDVLAIETEEEMLTKQKEMTLKVLQTGTSYTAEMEQVKKGISYFSSQVDSHYNLDFHPRTLLADDANDFSTKFYGDNNPNNRQDDEIHGTHVAGIVLASQNNGKGVAGVAKNVKLMTVRCVPNGDEYDKDVALGFRYAVDNGAKVINTSFGKSYSPHAAWVYEAIKYAEKHDVLIVNAAGNDAENIDVKASYPNDAPDRIHEISDNMITVGAMSSSYDEQLLASFSNYGKRNVDVFAPGVKVYAPVPNNGYQFLSGTSMAAPSTAGVAALLRSYYPKLSAAQVKHILMNSGTKIDFKVRKPGSEDLVSLDELCVSGRIVNALNAVKMAAAMVEK